MKYIITQEQVTSITNYLLQSLLPSVEVQKIASLLKSLPEEEVSEK